MQLSAIDANLLIILHPLLQTQSVSRAAAQLNLSPSATSHALARLRDLLGDELLVRAGRGLVLTPRGALLAPLVAEAVRAMERVLAPPPDFQPAALQRTFHLLYGSHLDWVLLPPLDAILRQQAPNLRLHTHVGGGDLSALLREGAVDLAFVLDQPLPPEVHTSPFMHERFVSMVRVGHPCLGATSEAQPSADEAAPPRLSMAQFLDLEHILVAPSGTAGGQVDTLLAERGLERRVARTFTSFLPAPFLVAQSDYILTLPASVARVARSFLAFELVQPPLQPPDYGLRMVWHERNHRDPAHRWFRDVVRGVGAQLSAERCVVRGAW